MPGEFPYDVFLSHSAKDKRSKPPTLMHETGGNPVVRDVAERLKKDRLRVWLDEWEIRPGDSIESPQSKTAKIEKRSKPPTSLDDQGGKGLERSRVLVLCMSANAFGSDWAQLESGTFRFRDPLNKERRFLPLRLDDAPIKGSPEPKLSPFPERMTYSTPWTGANTSSATRKSSAANRVSKAPAFPWRSSSAIWL
jgi:hypothetical protein